MAQYSLNQESQIKAADAVLAWLDSVSDEELFDKLSQCGYSIAYAIDPSIETQSAQVITVPSGVSIP